MLLVRLSTTDDTIGDLIDLQAFVKGDPQTQRIKVLADDINQYFSGDVSVRLRGPNGCDLGWLPANAVFAAINNGARVDEVSGVKIVTHGRGITTFRATFDYFGARQADGTFWIVKEQKARELKFTLYQFLTLYRASCFQEILTGLSGSPQIQRDVWADYFETSISGDAFLSELPANFLVNNVTSKAT